MRRAFEITALVFVASGLAAVYSEWGEELFRVGPWLRAAWRTPQKTPAPIKESGLSTRPFLGDAQTPRIESWVVRVYSDVTPASVVLAAGTDDGVREGTAFAIRRGNTIVGRVVAEKVLPTASGCRVVFTLGGRAIQVFDSASTRR